MIESYLTLMLYCANFVNAKLLSIDVISVIAGYAKIIYVLRKEYVKYVLQHYAVFVNHHYPLEAVFFAVA
ncbi:MAG: hypothetical protein DRO15_02470 [Thermoprotei archaeon]|nr:MAG: hypothetical protein DRO15_02470 [Thermoprotei archaeon]